MAIAAVAPRGPAFLRRKFGEAVFPDPIRVNTRHKAAPSHRKTIFDFERASGKGRSDYDKLVSAVEDRLLARNSAVAVAQSTAPVR